MSPTDHLERHFSPTTIAELLNVSTQTVIQWFEEEPGVIVATSNTGRRKRTYNTLRIPESVYKRVYERKKK